MVKTYLKPTVKYELYTQSIIPHDNSVTYHNCAKTCTCCILAIYSASIKDIHVVIILAYFIRYSEIYTQNVSSIRDMSDPRGSILFVNNFLYLCRRHPSPHYHPSLTALSTSLVPPSPLPHHSLAPPSPLPRPSLVSPTTYTQESSPPFPRL